MSRSIHSCIRLAAAGTILFAGSFALPAWSQSDAPKADNTKVNKRDKNPGAKTADSQKMNSGDTDITKKIRKSIMDDKSLSSYAHNVKVITTGGMVTLKGPVRTDEEKTTVEAKAKEVAGADKVTSEISVVPKKPKSKSTT